MALEMILDRYVCASSGARSEGLRSIWNSTLAVNLTMIERASIGCSIADPKFRIQQTHEPSNALILIKQLTRMKPKQLIFNNSELKDGFSLIN